MPETTEEARPVDTILRPRKHSRLYDKVIDVIKTLPWIVPITIIIWIYAEREQTVTGQKVTFPIAVRVESPHRIAALSNPADGLVVATFDGPIANLQHVIELLKANPDHPAIVYTVPAGTDRGTFRTLALSAIADNPMFAQYGIRVTDVAPAQLEIMVDDIDEPMVDVKPLEGLTNLEVVPQFSPAQVKIHAPHSMFGPDNRFVTAKLDTSKPGLHEHERVDVTWSHVGGEKNVSIEPPWVYATFTVRTRDVPKTISGIPIFIAEPAFTRTKYQITAPDSLPPINFLGPKDEIDQLSEGVKAFLELIDLREGDQTEQVRFEFPPSVHNVHVVSKVQDYTVTFHVSQVKQ
jgi:hypothetical protein